MKFNSIHIYLLVLYFLTIRDITKLARSATRAALVNSTLSAPYKLLSLNVTKEPISLTILHNGNMRTVFDEIKLPKGKDGTFSRLNGILVEGRKSKKDIFYFNVGNSHIESFLHKPLSSHIITQVMDVLKPDAVTLALRAFAGPREELFNFINQSNYPFLCSNINYTTPFLPYKTFELQNGLHMVVIGYVSPHINDFNNTVKARNPVEAINETIQTVKTKKKLIVVMGCSDLEMEKTIAKSIRGIRIIIGESVDPTTKMEYPIVYRHIYGKTLILRTNSAINQIGSFHATVNSNGKLLQYTGTLTDMLNETKTSQNLTDTLHVFKPIMERYDGEILARSRVDFNAKCRRQECNLGNMIADAFIEYKSSRYTGPYWTDTAIALVNAGSIKDGVSIEIRNGEITRSDILGILPYRQSLVSMTLSGDDLHKIIEKGLMNWETEDEKGSFLQVSGLRMICNKSLPAGERLQYLRARCAECFVPKLYPIEAEAQYRIITNEYLAKAGDEFTAMKAAKNVVYEPITDVDAVMAYIQKHRIIMTEVNERLGSITFLDGAMYRPNHFMIAIISLCFLLINLYQH